MGRELLCKIIAVDKTMTALSSILECEQQKYWLTWGTILNPFRKEDSTGRERERRRQGSEVAVLRKSYLSSIMPCSISGRSPGWGQTTVPPSTRRDATYWTINIVENMFENVAVAESVVSKAISLETLCTVVQYLILAKTIFMFSFT